MTRETKGADMETQGRITAGEIRARVRGRLEDAARAEAEHKAAERARIGAARWRCIAAKHEAMGAAAAAARFRAVADAEERGGHETDGAEAGRKAGFVGNALARAAGVRLVDVAATLAGWSAERVRNVALEAVADMGEDAPEFALEAATAAWWEARARVAVRGYMRSVGAEMFGANFHDGGERRACATSPDEYARKVQKECTGLLLEETENIFLSMKANQERNHAETMQEIGAVGAAVEKGNAQTAAALDALGEELDRERKRRAALAVKMTDLQKANPALWKFVEAWVEGGTQEEVAARYNRANGTHHKQAWVSRQLARLRQAFPSLALEPGGTGRFHNSRKAKKAAAGNRMASGEEKVELPQAPEGGWVGENDL